MSHLYAVSPLRNFWVRVYIGEGHLGGVSVLPASSDPPTITQGEYLYAYGQPDEVMRRTLSIEADVVKTSLSGTASMTVELWETIPSRYITRNSRFDPNRKFHFDTFTTTGQFGADGKAHLRIAIEII